MVNLKALFRRAALAAGPGSGRPAAETTTEKPLRGGLRRRSPSPFPVRKWQPPTKGKGTSVADRPRRRRRARAARAALRNAR